MDQLDNKMGKVSMPIAGYRSSSRIISIKDIKTDIGREFEISSVFHTEANKVFEFCRRGENFRDIFPERIEQVKEDDSIYVIPNQRFRFRQYLLNIFPCIWEVDITDWQQGPELFKYTDTMNYGPLKYFKHEHICKPIDDGCLYTDNILYTSPFGGQLADYLITRRYIKFVFVYRHKKMFSLLG